jgi:hypothetical protein
LPIKWIAARCNLELPRARTPRCTTGCAPMTA